MCSSPPRSAELIDPMSRLEHLSEANLPGWFARAPAQHLFTLLHLLNQPSLPERQKQLVGNIAINPRGLCNEFNRARLARLKAPMDRFRHHQHHEWIEQSGPRSGGIIKRAELELDELGKNAQACTTPASPKARSTR